MRFILFLFFYLYSHDSSNSKEKREVCASGLPSNLSYFYVTISLRDPCADDLSRGKFQLWSFEELMLKLMISFRILYTQAHPPHPFRFT